MKLHLRVIDGPGLHYRVITLRPSAKIRFSTNYFHDTWHILSSRRGAQLLGRLMWGLSYQQKKATVVLIHGEHIQPTPFGAERSDPILFCLSDTPTDHASLRRLQRYMRRPGPPSHTIRWHTFGLDRELAKPKAYDLQREDNSCDWMRFQENEWLWNAEHMFRRGGFVCYTAPAKVMRHMACRIFQLDPDQTRCGMDFMYLAEWQRAKRWRIEGEVQVFSNYDDRCMAAAEARRRVMAGEGEFADEESLYRSIAFERDQILHQRRH